MTHRHKLLHYPALYDHPGSDALFLAAMREITAYHIAQNPAYAEIAEQAGFRLDSLAALDDLHRIPPLPTLFLKRHTMFSRPEGKMIIKATTSGTSGRKSTVGIDLNTGLFALAMVWRSFRHYKLTSLTPTNYIILGYQPSRHNQAGIAKTAFGFTLIMPTLHRAYALKDTGDSYEVDIEGLVKALLRYEKQGFPVRFMGLPAYHHMLLTTLKDRGIRLKLHPKSHLCLGGGWKQFYFEHADKGELYRLAEEVLGIEEDHCIDFFGAVEHPVLYCDCKNHHFHIPAVPSSGMPTPSNRWATAHRASSTCSHRSCAACPCTVS
jgi:Coenzyme F390 synthetase